jgi:hypothetical protein
MPDDYTIQRVTEETELQLEGPPKAVVRVSFKVGTDGPFSRTYDRATFSPSTARTDIEHFVRELRELRRT